MSARGARQGCRALVCEPNTDGQEQQAGREFLSDGMSWRLKKTNAALKGPGLYP